VIAESDLNDLVSDSSQQELLQRFKSYRNEGMFTPPSRQGTIFFPGLDGGAEWGGPAFDPETQVIYINANEMPWVLFMTEVKDKKGPESVFDAGNRLYGKYCMSCHGRELEGSGNNPALTSLDDKYSPEEMGQLISTGRRMMPAFQYLHIDEVEALTSFVMNLGESRTKKFVTQPKPMDQYRNLRYTITGYNKFLTREGYPGIKPPWGSLNAINLSTGQLVWRIPLGEYPEFNEKGITTGTENYGGPIVTEGGLVFIAATSDSKIRAFNKRNGKLLWEYQLPAPGFATPSMYELNGRQYLVIACGGGKLGKKSGDAYVAFVLPNQN
jgi:quinoprotein glucose dehydrogenase